MDSFSTQNNEFSRSHSTIKLVDNSIRNDLINMDFPVSIINQAVELHSSTNQGTRRGNRRKQTIFYYVLSAYNSLGIAVEPKGLATKCGLKGSDISKAISRCLNTNIIQSQVKNVVVLTPQLYLKECLNRVKIHTDIELQFPENAEENLEKMANEIIIQKKNLLDQKPQMVAAAIVLYYLSTEGININKKTYANLFNISDMTITKIYKDVEEAYNSLQ